MKKVILSCFMMMSLMSFTESSKIQDKQELFSPECFSFADNMLNELSNLPIDYENAYNLWSHYYDRCESITDFDEFEFPIL